MRDTPQDESSSGRATRTVQRRYLREARHLVTTRTAIVVVAETKNSTDRYGLSASFRQPHKKGIISYFSNPTLNYDRPR